ncbi:MAG TPA: response regulator [Aggregatilineaceae bacterium]|nr:response regulator [Aggregatilineaceae bacterium]
MKKILVIEDEPAVLDNVLEMLTFEGFEAVGADNGLLGLQLAREVLPDLIICDIMMPGIDGYEVLQELRRDLETATVPLIFLTARGEREDMRKGMELGADDYITKPYSPIEVMAGIRTRLERKEIAERQRLRVLSHRLVEVQEAERRRIAYKLQDEIAELLTGLKVILEMSKRLPESSLRQRLDEAKELTEELISRTNELSGELWPAMLDDLGLLPTLLQHYKRYTDQTQVRVIFKHPQLNGRFPPEIETAAFRIVQEALMNVARHTRVNEVRVQLWADLDALSIQVEDQGEGFDVEAAISSGKGSGLDSMQERASLLGGQFTVTSAPGIGTHVIAWLPLVSELRRTTAPVPAPPVAALEEAISPVSSPAEKNQGIRGSAATVRIVLADSHDLIREGLRSVLENESEFSVVGEAATSQEAIALVEHLQPDVLIVDLGLERDIVGRVSQRFPKTRLLALSMHADEAYALEALRQGAAGYALKESAADDLVQAIRDVAAGRHHLSRTLSERAIDFYLHSPRTDEAPLDEHGVLTSREVEILKLVVQGSKNAEIADQLSISRRTVETHRANLMRKLGLRTQADLVRYALQRGLVALDD